MRFGLMNDLRDFAVERLEIRQHIVCLEPNLLVQPGLIGIVSPLLEASQL